jgi:hypothetical protein
VAARLNAKHQTSVREKIKASQLINRLQDHALGKVDMGNSHVRAACYLISQAIGNPPQELTGAGGGPLVVEIVKFGTDTPTS